MNVDDILNLLESVQHLSNPKTKQKTRTLNMRCTFRWNGFFFKQVFTSAFVFLEWNFVFIFNIKLFLFLLHIGTALFFLYF